MPGLSDWTKDNFTVDAPAPDKAVPQVTAGLAIATALLTAVGIGSGITVRILRNDPLWVVVFVLVLLSSICLAAFAAKRKWLVIAGAVFMAALGGFTWLAGDVSRAAERPHLVATAETSGTGLMKISTTVKADGLRTNELIYLLARGHTRVAIDPTTGGHLNPVGMEKAATQQSGSSSFPDVLVKEAAFGPNASGSVDALFSFEVSPALFKDVFIMVSRDKGYVRGFAGSGDPYEPECIPGPGEKMDPDAAGKINRACVRFILPFGAIRPTVSASFNVPNEAGVRLLTTNVAAVEVPPSRGVFVKTWAGKTLLMQQTLAPDLAGKVAAALTLPISKLDTDICVVAMLVSFDTTPIVERDYCDKPGPLPLEVAFAHLLARGEKDRAGIQR